MSEENKIYELQGLKFQRRKLNMAFYRDVKNFAFLWENYLADKTEDLQKSITEDGGDFKKLLSGVNFENNTLSPEDVDILAKNISEDEAKALYTLSKLEKFGTAIQNVKDMFLWGYTEIKDDKGSPQPIQTMELLVKTYLTGTTENDLIEKINYDPDTEEETINLISSLKEILEDFFLYSQKLTKLFQSSPRTLNTLN